MITEWNQCGCGLDDCSFCMVDTYLKYYSLQDYADNKSTPTTNELAWLKEQGIKW